MDENKASLETFISAMRTLEPFRIPLLFIGVVVFLIAISWDIYMVTTGHEFQWASTIAVGAMILFSFLVGRLSKRNN